MTLPAWIRSFFTAAALALLAGAGAPFAAPSPVPDSRLADDGSPWAGEDQALDENYWPGMHGIDYAAITGPRGPRNAGAVPACADPARRGELKPCLK